MSTVCRILPSLSGFRVSCPCRVGAAAAKGCEVQVVDEMSNDGTPDRLRHLGVHVIEAKKVQGVTANWNMVRHCAMT